MILYWPARSRWYLPRWTPGRVGVIGQRGGRLYDRAQASLVAHEPAC
jgi:hypothetical protein